MRRVRAISHWATAAMLGVAGFALVYVFFAFVPLVDVWAAHRPGRSPAALAGTVRIGAWVLLALLFAVAVVAFAGWARRARSNLVAFGIRTRRGLPLLDVAVGSVGRSPRLRRRILVLTWLWWLNLLAAGVAVLAGVLSGLDNLREIDDVRAQTAAGQPVDRTLVSDLFGGQLLLRLPAAALFVAAAVCGVLLIARVTSAQYGRVARLRGATVLPPALAALRSTEDDWTVVLAAPAPAGGTIRE